MGGLVYDAGVLLAAADGDRTVWDLHRGALERNEIPLVVAPVLALAWAVVAAGGGEGAGRTAGRTAGPAVRSVGRPPVRRPTGRAATLAGLLRGCALADFPVAAACDAGRLLARAGSTDLAAAAVVLAAVTTRSAVVTTAPQRLRALADLLRVDLAVAGV